MTNDRKDDAPAGSAEERPKRTPPTIDLEASEVSGDTQAKGTMDAARGFARGAAEKILGLSGILAWLVAPLSGALAALLVLAAFWAAGLIGQPESPQPVQASVSPTQFNSVAANVGDLSTRLSRVEASAARPVTPATDPALATRADALEKSLAAVREEVGRVNGQLRTLSSSLTELRVAPRDGAAPAVDLGPLSDRLTKLEDATRTLSSELAKPASASADDVNVRRLVVANTLDAAVRRGEPFAAALAAAKQVAADPASLAPLDPYSARGIPAEGSYLREIVQVLQRIADANVAKSKSAATSTETASGTVLDRLQSGLAKLVRVERDAGPVVREPPPPAAHAAVLRRDDLAAARQDVAKLPQASDPQVAAWLKSVDGREAALTASQKFSAEALAAFGKSGQ
jgi:hypothetical protein